ncbi:uncharacterized protein LOC143208964 [Lasioglossum baleicum]|uniref:uncharacterized protein LOC143208964 n=1 Tax=Lasioglossum baleicum TaxID=434251 RepID=UPI003FCDE376
MKKLEDQAQEREQIQQDTVGQCNNSKWLMYKSDMLTASYFGKVCRRLKTTRCAKLVEVLVRPKPLNVAAVRYGKQNEAAALAEFSTKENVKIEDCGLFIDASLRYLGASPDGLIGDDGIVEVKCPKTAENLTPEEALHTVTTVREMFEDSTGSAMSKSHDYYYQVQGQLHITGRKYCLFGVWTKKGIKVIRVERDDVFWQLKMEPQLSRFYIHCMLPEIIDSRKERGNQYILDEIAKAAKKKLETARRKAARTSSAGISKM